MTNTLICPQCHQQVAPSVQQCPVCATILAPPPAGSEQSMATPQQMPAQSQFIPQQQQFPPQQMPPMQQFPPQFSPPQPTAKGKGSIALVIGIALLTLAVALVGVLFATGLFDKKISAASTATATAMPSSTSRPSTSTVTVTATSTASSTPQLRHHLLHRFLRLHHFHHR